jgi:predicted MFS family arabinose efflux permease
VAWFAVASLLCAAAPGVAWLIAARALQGVGGALLTPASLAILESTFHGRERGKAIGAWSGLSGTASAIAPFIGGWLLSSGGWRWVFLINPPVALLVIAIALRHVPETRSSQRAGRIDAVGAALGIVALGGVSAGLIAASDALLLLVIELETVSRVSPLLAGAALLPITGVMLVLAAPFGALAVRTGPRLPMTVGPLISATGLAMLTTISARSHYFSDVLPAVSVFGLGLAVFVAPLTATALGSVPAVHAATASGVNNAVARSAGLIAVAALPAIVGLSGDAYDDATRLLAGFREAIWICAVLHVCGGLLAAVTIEGRTLHVRGSCGLSLAGQPVASAALPATVGATRVTPRAGTG